MIIVLFLVFQLTCRFWTKKEAGGGAGVGGGVGAGLLEECELEGIQRSAKSDWRWIIRVARVPAWVRAASANITTTPTTPSTANNSKYLLYFKTGKLEARSMCLLSCTLCHRQQSTRATLLDNWKAPSDPINSISRKWLLLLVVPSFLFGIPILVIIRRRAPDTVLIWSCSVLFRSSINNPTWRSFYTPAFCSPRHSSLCWKWK